MWAGLRLLPLACALTRLHIAPLNRAGALPPHNANGANELGRHKPAADRRVLGHSDGVGLACVFAEGADHHGDATPVAICFSLPCQTRPGCFVSSVYDRTLHARPYETADEREARILEKVCALCRVSSCCASVTYRSKCVLLFLFDSLWQIIMLQSYVRRWLAKRFVTRLRTQRAKFVQWKQSVSQLHTHVYMYTHTCIYIYIYIYIQPS
jgi:hypothetical protein